MSNDKKDSKINNMNDLRDATLDTIQRLRNGEIDVSEAQTMAKLCDSVISTVNSQFTFAKMVNEVPSIPFMEASHQNRLETHDAKVIEGRVMSRLDQLK